MPFLCHNLFVHENPIINRDLWLEQFHVDGTPPARRSEIRQRHVALQVGFSSLLLDLIV